MGENEAFRQIPWYGTSSDGRGIDLYASYGRKELSGNNGEGGQALPISVDLDASGGSDGGRRRSTAWSNPSTSSPRASLTERFKRSLTSLRAGATGSRASAVSETVAAKGAVANLDTSPRSTEESFEEDGMADDREPFHRVRETDRETERQRERVANTTCSTFLRLSAFPLAAHDKFSTESLLFSLA